MGVRERGSIVGSRNWLGGLSVGNQLGKAYFADTLMRLSLRSQSTEEMQTGNSCKCGAFCWSVEGFSYSSCFKSA